MIFIERAQKLIEADPTDIHLCMCILLGNVTRIYYNYERTRIYHNSHRLVEYIPEEEILLAYNTIKFLAELSKESQFSKKENLLRIVETTKKFFE